jgi:hypothetical protein
VLERNRAADVGGGVNRTNLIVMPGDSRSKNGVASRAYVPGMHVLKFQEVVDGRVKPGHDGKRHLVGTGFSPR